MVAASVDPDTTTELLVEVDEMVEGRWLLCSWNVEFDSPTVEEPFVVAELVEAACLDQLHLTQIIDY